MHIKTFLFSILCFGIFSLEAFSQHHSIEKEMSKEKEFKSLKEALLNPGAVKRLSLDFEAFSKSPEVNIFQEGDGSGGAPNTMRSPQEEEKMTLEFREKVLSKLVKFPNLRYLKISQGKFMTMPSEVINLPELRFLEMYFTGLKKLPNEMKDMKNLEGLSLVGNSKLKYGDGFGTVLSELPMLKFVNLGHTRITEIPAFVFEMKSLEKLRLHQINLVTIPESLLALPKFSQFECAQCEIDVLQSNIADYQLTELNLWRTTITSFPSSMNKMTNIESLNIWGDGNLELPEMDYSKLRVLTANNVKSLPESINTATNLEELELYIPGTNLPVLIKDFKKLKSISLGAFSDREQLIEILSHCSSLEKITISFKDNLPENFLLLKNLPNLKKIIFMGSYGSSTEGQQSYIRRSLGDHVEVKYY